VSGNQKPHASPSADALTPTVIRHERGHPTGIISFDIMARTDEPFSSERSSKAEELLKETFLNEEHIEAFQEALALNDLIPDPTPVPQQESNGTMSPGLDRPGPGRRRGSMASIYGWEKVESIKSLSDFAPVHQRVSRYVIRMRDRGEGIAAILS
jgi:hypothetical protein